MAISFPGYLSIPAARLGEGHSVSVRQVADAEALARDMAEAICAEIVRSLAENGRATVIVPVGPVDQFPILAQLLNGRNVSCRNVAFINMDEYLTDGGRRLAKGHPLSFRGFMDRGFYDRLRPELAPPLSLRVFPDPNHLEAIAECIRRREGVDACFGGIGINGHLAFNEPPAPGQFISDEAFAASTTRVVELARETRAINSATVGGELSIIPQRAVTIGMKEILESRRLRFYCNRPWQSAVVRRALHGEISARCPASFLRTHCDASATVTAAVAQPPQIRLR